MLQYPMLCKFFFCQCWGLISSSLKEFAAKVKKHENLNYGNSGKRIATI